MRLKNTKNLIELEALLIEALLNSCPPGCSHEGNCSKANENIYMKGIKEAKKYKK